MTSERLLRQEVKELTELFRRDPGWRDLRAAALAKGLPPDETLLAGFCEDEEGREYGAFVTRDGRVFEFVRSADPGAKGFRRFREQRDLVRAVESHQAVRVAVAMNREGRHEAPATKPARTRKASPSGKAKRS